MCIRDSNEIKAQIIRAGMTMQEVVDLLSDEYGWSDSVSNPVSYTHLDVYKRQIIYTPIACGGESSNICKVFWKYNSSSI